MFKDKSSILTSTRLLTPFFLLVLFLLFFTSTALGEPQLFREGEGIGLRNVIIDVPIIEATGTESVLDCNLIPLKGKHEFDLQCEFPQEFWDDTTTMNLGQFKKKYSEFGNYFEKNSDFVKWVKMIQDDGYNVEAKGLSERQDTKELQGREWSTKVKLDKGGKDRGIRVGDNSLEVFLGEGELTIVTTPEDNVCDFLLASGQCRHDVTVIVDNNSLGVVPLSLESFGFERKDLKGFSFWMTYPEKWYSVEPSKDVCIEKVDPEFGTYCEWDYHRLPDGNIDWDYNYLQEHTRQVRLKNAYYTDENNVDRVNEDAFVVVPSGETMEFQMHTITSEELVVYNSGMQFDGDWFWIDPTLSNDVATSLEHDFDFNGWVSQISEGTHMGSWTWTGELDWNKEAVNTTTSGGWGEIVTDFNIQADNLVGLWHLNGDAEDSSGNDNDGTNNGADLTATGLWGTSAGEFDGDDDYINWTTSSSFRDDIDTAVTISAWIKPDGSSGVIFSGGDNDGALTKGYRFDLVGNNIRFGVGTGTGSIETGDDTAVGEWQHVVGTWDGSNILTYLNGIASSGTAKSGTATFETTTFSIGARNVGSYHFDGSIDEVAIWNTALSSQEVKELYEEQKGQWLDENLVAYYKFNEECATDTVCDSARGHDGSLESGASVDAYGMWDSNALSLDGDSDYVDLGSSPSFKNDLQGTMSGWFKTDSTALGHIIGASDGTSQHTFRLLLHTDGAIRIADSDSGDSDEVRTTSTGWNDDKWHHLSITSNGLAWKIYVDGEEQGLTVTGGANTGDWFGDQTGMDKFYIGVRNSSGLIQYFDGELDEVKIYDRALTPEEILADYNSFLEARFVDSNVYGDGTNSDWNAIKVNSDLNFNFNSELCGSADTGCSEETYFSDANLVGLWHLNDINGDGWTFDSSGNNIDVALANGATIIDGGLWDSNKATFDGVNDRGETEISDWRISDTQGTVSYWIKSSDPYSILSSAKSNSTLYYLLFGAYETLGCYVQQRNADTYDLVHGSSSVDDNAWHMCTISSNGSAYTVYLDGKEDGTTIYSSGGSGSNTGDWFADTLYRDNIALGVLKHNNGFLGYHEGDIEEVAIYNRALSETEIRNLYRKGVSRLDLNVIACNDTACSDEEGSEYFSDINNNTWNYFTSLPNSEYFKWEAFLKPNYTDFNDQPAGFFHVGALIQDVNIEYEEASTPITSFQVDFNVYKTGTSTHLTDLNYSCTGGTYNYSDNLVNSPVGLDMNVDSYSCLWETTGYDSNTVSVNVVDANQVVVVYLREYSMVTYNVRDTNGYHLTNWDMDINVGTDLVGANSPTTQNMVNGSYQSIFSKTGYDSNTIDFVVNGSDINVNVTLSITPIPTNDINFIYPTNEGIAKANIAEFYLTSDANITDANYTLNSFSTVDLNTECTDWNTIQVYCNVTGLPYSTLYDNNLTVCFNYDGDTPGDHCETISFTYNPSFDLLLPGGKGSYLLFFLFGVIVIIGIVAIMVYSKN